MMIGAHSSGTAYELCNDVTETGGQVSVFARFGTLEEAAVVLRYLKGAHLTEEDERTAKAVSPHPSQ